jgi:medium-chain acyl-[acyl-carrier-protein] hydrolase
LLQFNKNIYRKRIIHNPKLRIIFIHHAGGSALSYFKFCEYFPKSWEICFLEIPGRGRDISEKPIQNREELHSFLDFTTKELNDSPIALFGHSMGAHIAFEYAHFLRIKNNSSLALLAISGKNPPKINPSDHDGTPLHLKSNETLLERIKSMGGTPAEFFESPELMDFFLPILKDDLNLCYQLETTCLKFLKLNVPISIFAGKQDERALPQEMLGWRNFTTSHFMVQEYQGGHFYFQGLEQDIAQDIIQNLTHLNLVTN